MVFFTSKLIYQSYKANEFQPIIIHGSKLGIGKSVYMMKVILEVLNECREPIIYDNNSWNLVRQNMWFHPNNFVLDIRKRFENINEIVRTKVGGWDDAGLWLHVLDWYDPVVKSINKYFNVVRTNFGGFMFTSPILAWIVNKIKELPDVLFIKIIKSKSSTGYPSERNQRRAIIYKPWQSADGKKHGVNKLGYDDFNVMMPNFFYWAYKPMRDYYAKIAVDMMYDALKNKTGEVKRVEYPHER